jgi:hypothetical protein
METTVQQIQAKTRPRARSPDNTGQSAHHQPHDSADMVSRITAAGDTQVCWLTREARQYGLDPPSSLPRPKLPGPGQQNSRGRAQTLGTGRSVRGRSRLRAGGSGSDAALRYRTVSQHASRWVMGTGPEPRRAAPPRATLARPAARDVPPSGAPRVRVGSHEGLAEAQARHRREDLLAVCGFTMRPSVGVVPAATFGGLHPIQVASRCGRPSRTRSVRDPIPSLAKTFRRW